MAVSAGTKVSGGSEVKLAVLIGTASFVLLMLAWGFNRLILHSRSENRRPEPTWLSLSQVRSQTSDGRMLSVKVNLMLKDKDDLDELKPYTPAFKAIVAQTGSEMSSEDAVGSQRIVHFGESVKESINDYLNEERVKPRIRRVAFEEFRLMP